MNTKHVLSLTALAVCAALGTSAMAQTNINFKGNVVADSCTVTVDGTGTTVTLEDIAVSELGNSIGSATSAILAKEKVFNLHLSGCVPANGVAQLNFSQAASVDGRLTNAVGSGYAIGVSLQLLSSNSSPLMVTTAPTSQFSDPLFDLPGGATTVPYAVRYHNDVGLGVTPGAVEATAVATVNYL